MPASPLAVDLAGDALQLEGTRRVLHDTANLMTSVLAATGSAAAEIDAALARVGGDPILVRHLESARQDLLFLEHAGRLAAHVLRARPQLLGRSAPFVSIESDSSASLPDVLDLAVRAATPVVAPRAHLVVKAGTTRLVRGDVRDFAAVVFNLLINAAEAMSCRSRDNNVITCSSHDYGADQVYVQVRDNGSGMSTERLNEALNPSRMAAPHGRGRGLAICREIVQLAGGRLTLHNDEGLVARLHLPVHYR